MSSPYHKSYADADLSKHQAGDPFYWNFLEMEFDPNQADPEIGLRIRNMIDAPQDPPRGGGALETSASQTGRLPSGRLPAIKTLPHADVRFTRLDGRPIRGTRSDADGIVREMGLVDVPPGESVLMIAVDGNRTDSRVIEL